MRFAIVVHGGAGLHGESSERAVNAAMNRACLKAAEILRSKGTALDAVEAAIRELEDDEALNADKGYGSNLTTCGHVECDASLMANGSFGGVGAVRGIKNPVSAARVVLERARHGRRTILGRVSPVLICGEGAVAYVTEEAQQPLTNLLWPPEKVPIESLIGPRAQREWIHWSERYRLASEVPIKQEIMSVGDTVGTVVICEDGDAASGVSSGGLLLKYPGRIGEAAVYGAGCWTACERVPRGGIDGIALSVSGTGEEIIQAALARTIGEACNPAICEDPLGTLTETFHNFIGSTSTGEPVNRASANAGAVTLISESREDGTSSVRVIVAFTTPSMAVATFSSEDQTPKASIHRANKRQSKPSLYLSSRLITQFHPHDGIHR